MKRLLIALVAIGLVACGPDYDPVDDLGYPPADTLAPADSGKAPKSQAPDTTKSGKVIPAQAACENSVTLNGMEALPGANYVSVSSLPSRLELKFTDCPHPEAVVRDNYVRTGYGSGEIWVSLRVRRGLTRIPQSMFLANQGAKLDSGHAFRITDTTGGLQKAITRPGGWGYPQEVTGVATLPASGTWNLAIHKVPGQPAEDLELKVNVFHSEIRDNGRIGTRALVLRTE